MKPREFLALLDGVHTAGKDKWTARCPAHDDRKSSLSVRAAPDRILVNCFAGCQPEQIAAARGLTLADLFFDDRNGHGQMTARIVATYDYHDERGQLLYQVCRLEPKDFRQRRPDGHGGWTWKLEGARRVVYRLHELAEASCVWHPEGEKDADALVALGLRATTTPGGAAAWRDEYADQIKAAGVSAVMLLPDNDPPGEEYGAKVAQAYLQREIRVKLVRLPGLPPKGDVSDWLAAAHTVDELQTLADVTPWYETPPAKPLAGSRVMLTAEDAPHVVQQGDAYVLACTAPDGRAATITLSAIREHSDGLYAEYTGTLGDCDPVWGKFGLAAPRARTDVAKALACGLGCTINYWRPLLDRVCRETAALVRRGSPAVPVTPQPAPGEMDLIKPIAPHGHTAVIAGDGGAGKTTLALALALAALNEAMLPGGIRAARRIAAALLLDWETTKETVDELVYLLCRGQDWSAAGLHYKAMTAPLADQIAAIKSDVARLGVDLVIVDSLAPASGIDPEGANAAVSFHTALRSLGQGVTRVVTAHVNAAAAQQARGAARPFGSVFNNNLPRSVWELRRSTEDADDIAVALYHRKVNRGRLHPAIALTFEYESDRITVRNGNLADAPDLMARAGLTPRILDVLSRGPATVAEIAQELGEDPDNVRAMLHKLKDRNLVTQLPGPKPVKWGLLARC